MVCIMSARFLEDGKIVFGGAGMPLVSCILAQKLHAPRLTILFEGGVIGPHIEVGKMPPSTNEQRAGRPKDSSPHPVSREDVVTGSAAQMNMSEINGSSHPEKPNDYGTGVMISPGSRDFSQHHDSVWRSNYHSWYPMGHGREGKPWVVLTK